MRTNKTSNKQIKVKIKERKGKERKGDKEIEKFKYYHNSNCFQLLQIFKNFVCLFANYVIGHNNNKLLI